MIFSTFSRRWSQGRYILVTFIKYAETGSGLLETFNIDSHVLMAHTQAKWVCISRL